MQFFGGTYIVPIAQMNIYRLKQTKLHFLGVFILSRYPFSTGDVFTGVFVL